MEHLGSVYVGDYKNKRMEGKGSYKLPTGSIYEGELKDGMYHGKGKIKYANGEEVIIEFSNGYPVSGTFVFPDGLEFAKNKWQYCDGNDRRFATELKSGLNAAGEEKESDTAIQKIPDGFFDIGNGVYDAENRIVYDYKLQFVRNADISEHEWAIANCRKGQDEFIGGQPNPCRPELSDPRVNDTEWNKLNQTGTYDDYVKAAASQKH